MRFFCTSTEGYRQADASGWGPEGHTVVFYHQNGQAARRFTTMEKKGEPRC